MEITRRRCSCCDHHHHHHHPSCGCCLQIRASEFQNYDEADGKYKWKKKFFSDATDSVRILSSDVPGNWWQTQRDINIRYPPISSDKYGGKRAHQGITSLWTYPFKGRLVLLELKYSAKPPARIMCKCSYQWTVVSLEYSRKKNERATDFYVFSPTCMAMATMLAFLKHPGWERDSLLPYVCSLINPRRHSRSKMVRIVSGARGATKCVTDVLTTFWRHFWRHLWCHLWSITEQTHSNEKFICFIR